MSWEEREDTTIYKVVINHEEQYSIWPADRENALGWRDAGKTGTKQECLAYIEEVWTDMRPLSLRKAMAAAAENPPTAAAVAAPPDDLVERLTAGNHPVVLISPKEEIDRGFVYIKFTGTRGVTELGIRLDAGQTRYANGSVHLVGGVNLNFVPVRFVADIELATMSGPGRLERL